MRQPACYQIEVEGHLDESWADWFGPPDIVVEVKGEVPVTRLSNVVIDQTGLIGLIRQLHGMGMVLLSITRVD